MSALHDMHVHLAFVDGAREAALDAAASGTLLFSNTVEPREFLRHCADAAGWRDGNGDALLGTTLFVGVGLHPWRVGPDRLGEDLALIEEYARTYFGRGLPALFGEVGLDFSPRHESTAAAQVEAFEFICRLARGIAGDGDSDAGRAARPVLSIHAVRSASTVLDVLERTGCLDRHKDGDTACAAILHWFSGTGDVLHRAVQKGCFFSVGPRMVASRRGREYARQIPLRQLLLETDDPEGEGVDWPFDRIGLGLRDAFETICDARGVRGTEATGRLADEIDANARRLLFGGR